MRLLYKAVNCRGAALLYNREMMTYNEQLCLFDSLERFESIRRRIRSRRAFAERAQDIRRLVRLANLLTAVERQENAMVSADGQSY